MSSKINFIVNNRIEIELEDGLYKSNIQDVTDEYIGISIPVNDGRYLPLKKDDKVIGYYYYGKDVYKFDTVVIGRKIDKILIIMLKKPDRISMIQRRNYVRVPMMLNVYCAIINTDKGISNLTNNQIDFFDAYSLDISGGGMKLALDRKLEGKIRRGDILLVTVPHKNENLTIKGKIMRIDNDRKNSKIICGLSFLDLDKRTRESIIGIVFEIMRHQMKTGAKGD